MGNNEAMVFICKSMPDASLFLTHSEQVQSKAKELAVLTGTKNSLYCHQIQSYFFGVYHLMFLSMAKIYIIVL